MLEGGGVKQTIVNKEAREFKEQLDSVAGNKGVSKKWNWAEAATSEQGMTDVPGKKGNPDLVLVDDQKKIQQICQSTRAAGCLANENGIAKLVLPTAQEFNKDSLSTGSSYAKDDPSLAAARREAWPRPQQLDNGSDTTKAITLKSAVIHELEHATRDTVNGGEFRATRREYNHLAKTGAIHPVSDDHVLRDIMHNLPHNVQGISVMQRFNGELTPEVRKWFPGGEEFKAATGAVLKAATDRLDRLSPQGKASLTSELTAFAHEASSGKEFLSGVSHYFAEQFRRDYQKGKGHTDEKMELLSKPITSTEGGFRVSLERINYRIREALHVSRKSDEVAQFVRE